MNIANNIKNLLADGGIDFTESMATQSERYVALIREWNAFASLVSAKDLEALESGHLPDSFSLAPLILAECGPAPLLLDIGSGGGFPAIPLKIVMPGLKVRMVERGVKKVGFLEKVLGTLHLEDVQVVHGNFPEVDAGEADVITARAVEKPGRLLPQIAAFMKPGSVFLCQMGKPNLDERFHVKQIDDAWKAHGLRRSELYVVRRLKT